MRARPRRGKAASPLAGIPELMSASLETIARRTALMWTGACSAKEYRRMVREKAVAAAAAAALVTRSGGTASLSELLDPWRKRASANAKRLRKKRVNRAGVTWR